MTFRAAFGLVAAAAVLAAALAHRAATESPADSPFPHREHASLFPVCASCHLGIETGETALRFPQPESCLSCHDGERAPPVDWTGPRRHPTNLRFDHPVHEAASDAAGETATCQTCHGVDGGRDWMHVAAAAATGCIGCHAHEAPEHLAATADCRTCHVPLAAADRMGAAWVAALPRPPWHDEPGFLRAHAGTDVDAAAGTCAVCHARQSCERCHANAAAVPAIAALDRDDRVATIVRGLAPSYPLPESHLSRDWRIAHGAEADASAGTCANCHTRPSCDACHIGPGARDRIAVLPDPVPGGAPGVAPRLALDPVVVRGGRGTTAASLVHPPEYVRFHGAAAASSPGSCEGCHAQSYCADCHQGTDSRRFHPPNFGVRHATEVYGAAADCASCHNREVFCRACHEGAGLATSGRLDVAFHDAQPLWLLQHGQAARQNLESCATCHAQRDCMQCHSAAGGWRVNPHGRGFDVRVADRNLIACSRCHLGGPPRRP